MFSSLSLKTKVFLLVTAVVVVTFLAVTLLVSHRSIENSKRDAFNLAEETAASYKNEILAELQSSRVTSETLAIAFEVLKDHKEISREIVNDIVKKALARKEYLTAICITYEPNALDGKDAEYAGKPGQSDTGRFAPFWYKADGTINLQPIYDSEIETSGWYTVPRATKREHLTDPFPYMVKDQMVMLTSMVFPIFDDGEFVGIVSSDFTLDKLQEMVSRVNERATGEYSEILSNSGAIVAHPDKHYLARDLREIVLYELIASGRNRASDVLDHAREYMSKLELVDGREDERNQRNLELAGFIKNLEVYMNAPDGTAFNWPSISPELAGELLTVDKKRQAYANEAKEAIKNGKLYIHNGDRFYTVYMPIKLSEATTPWSVAVNVPMAEVLKSAQGLRDYVLMMSLISICLIAVVLYLVVGSVTKPFLLLANTARSLGEGDLDAKVPQRLLNRGGDEIGVLSRAFKAMAEKINDLVTRLQNYAHELEEKNSNLNKLNEMLIAAKDQAEESSRAKTNFLSNMSHEMRTPLNAIIGMTSIGKGTPGAEKKDYAFAKIQDASTHLLGVVNDILDMSKIEASKLELSDLDFDFEKMLRKVVNFINFRVDEKQQDFRVSVDPEIPRRLSGDEQRLSQVLTNLLTNAVKFTPEGGSIRLSTTLEAENGGNCTIRFEVSDNGIGISQEQQTRLFQAFQQADSSTSRDFGGTGLGLVISKRIVEMMGGRIWIESELGQGSKFIFTVRLFRASADKHSPLAAGVNWKNIRIMAVDDDPEVLEYFRETAQGFGISCDSAASGEEALAFLDKNISHDIYFIDWRMPGMSGIELSREIKKRRPENAVVTMISSVEWSTIADDAKAAGVDRFLAKPLFRSDIADCINEFLGNVEIPDQTAHDEDLEGFAGRHILLAEDVEINREICISLLEPAELVIDSAENGEEALRMFAENPDRYDLILMDVQMPKMDGLEATRQIRALDNPRAKTIPIVAMTANVFREDIEKCLAAGMNDHMGKPLDTDILFSKLRMYLGK